MNLEDILQNPDQHDLTPSVLGTCTVDDKGDGKEMLAGKQVQTVYSKGAKELTAEQAKSDNA